MRRPNPDELAAIMATRGRIWNASGHARERSQVTGTSTVTRHRRAVTNVFDLLGRDENDLTAALGFTLAHSPALLVRLAHRLLPGADVSDAAVRMEVRDELGRTDLEVEASGQLAVIEAKKGWLLPDELQLAAYAPRVVAARAGTLATLSNASAEWAKRMLPETVGGIPVQHLPWTVVREDLASARRAARGEERHWLDELDEYLRKAIRVIEPADSWTYCVVINTMKPGGGGARNFRDFVDEGIYFHPYGVSRWPRTPPNFMAFRWGNQVQRAHRVMSATLEPSLPARWPDIPVTELTDRPHAVYELGPALPGLPIPSGRTYRASRLWVLLDQLLTAPTLAEAAAGTWALARSATPQT